MSQSINLLEPARNAAPDGTLYRHALIGVLLLAAALGTFWALEQAALSNARAELARDQAESDRLLHEQAALAAPNAQWLARIDAEEHEVQGLEIIAQQLHSGALGSTRSFAGPLRAFGRATAPGVWLTALTLDNTNNAMMLEGKATDASRVPGLLQALEAEPAFEGTRFETIELSPAATDASAKGSAVVFHIVTPGSSATPATAAPDSPAPAAAHTLTTAANP